MATIKSYTDLEQSKKLAEILPLESADMHSEAIEVDGDMVFVVVCGLGDKTKSNYGSPVWSLAALINVLPDTITSNDVIAFKLNIKKDIIEYSNPSLYLIYKSVKSDNPVDACYEMILKLYELKML